MVKTCGSFTDVKKPEHALKLFVRFALAKGVITYGMELMFALFNICLLYTSKLDKITDEVRLRGRENISTDEQLFSYKTSLEKQMENLVAGRTHLRKKIRTNIDDGQLQAAKDEIASINGAVSYTHLDVYKRQAIQH